MKSLENTLKRYWGFDRFRPLQKEIIHSIIEGKDTIGLLPTGGGKSLCYQLPALMGEGITVVVSPLIALMQDQVKQLKERKIPALMLERPTLNPELLPLTSSADFLKVKSKNGNGPKSNNPSKPRKRNNRKRY